MTKPTLADVFPQHFTLDGIAEKIEDQAKKIEARTKRMDAWVERLMAEGKVLYVDTDSVVVTEPMPEEP